MSGRSTPRLAAGPRRVLRTFRRRGLLRAVLPGGLELALVVGLVTVFGLRSTAGLVIGGLLGLLALVIIVRGLRRRESPQSLTASYPMERVLALVLAAGAYSRQRPEDPLWIWLAAAVGVLAVLSEPTVRSQLARVRPVAVQLAGVTAVPEAPFSPGLLAWIAPTEALIGGLLALLRAPGWAWTALVLIGSVALLAQLLHSLRATRTTRRWPAELAPALAAYGPVFAFSYSGVKGAAYQLGMWLPYLDRLERRYVVITRSAATVPAIRALTRAPILIPRDSGFAALDTMLTPTVRTVFYCQGPANNLMVLRFRQLMHVFLNHGDSDKAASYNPRHANYDKIFVSGEQAIARYTAHGSLVARSQFVIVGRPQVERVELRDTPLPAGGPRTVLYAPTWHGGRPSMNYSSLSLGRDIIAALLKREATVIFRPHPLSASQVNEARQIEQIQALLEADRARTGRAHVFGAQAERTWDLPDCFNASDALITDVSSVASDYLASGKPLAMAAIRQSGDRFRRDAPIAKVAYVIEKDLSTLDATVDALFGPDPLAEERRAYRTYCLSDNVGPQAADAFLREAGEIIDVRSRAHARTKAAVR